MFKRHTSIHPFVYPCIHTRTHPMRTYIHTPNYMHTHKPYISTGLYARTLARANTHRETRKHRPIHKFTWMHIIISSRPIIWKNEYYRPNNISWRPHVPPRQLSQNLRIATPTPRIDAYGPITL